MLNDALSVVSKAFNGAWAVFERVFTRLDATGVVIAIFAVSIILSLIIAPIRGGSLTTGASDGIRVTENRTYNHNTKKWTHTTSYSQSRRQKK